MKNFIKIIWGFTMIICLISCKGNSSEGDDVVPVTFDKTVKAATYNIRIQTSSDKDAKSWTSRKEYVGKLINSYSFDIFGVQEIANAQQETDLKTLLPDYNYLAKGRDSETGISGERVAILYKKNRFTLIDQGFFFLSPTPNVASIGWDAKYNRVCVWAKFADKGNANKQFYYFCTHFDNEGVLARQESAKLIDAKIAEIAQDNPVIFVGDLNASPLETVMYQNLTSYLSDCKSISTTTPTGSTGTFNGQNMTVSNFPETARIDYLFCRNLNILSHSVISDKYVDAAYPSDHFPVMVKFNFK